MPFIVPDDLADLFTAYVASQGDALPPSFASIGNRLSAVFTVPASVPRNDVAATRRHPSTEIPSTTSLSTLQSAPVPSVRRGRVLERARSVPIENSWASRDTLSTPPRELFTPLPTLPAPRHAPLTPPSPQGSLDTQNTLAAPPGDTPPRFLSPLIVPGSPVSTLPQKRSSTAAGFGEGADDDDYWQGDEDEDAEDPEDAEDTPSRRLWPLPTMDWVRRERERQQKDDEWTGIRMVIRGGAGGAGGGHGAGAAGGPVNAQPTKKCKGRRGDAPRRGQAADIGYMPAVGGAQQGDEEEEDNSSGMGRGRRGLGGRGRGRGGAQGGSKHSKKGGKEAWRVDDVVVPVMQEPGILLAKLLAIFTSAHRERLDKLLQGPPDSSVFQTTSFDTASVAARIHTYQADIHFKELHLMLDYIQLALNCDSERAEYQLKNLPKKHSSYEVLATKYAPPGVAARTFQDWVHFGKRLVILSAAGSLYLLPILAVLNLRTDFLTHAGPEQLLVLANALRRVKEGQWDAGVQQLMVPLFHMRHLSGGYLSTLRLHRNVPKMEGAPPEVISFGFSEWETSDKVFDSVETNYPRLARRSDAWTSSSVPAWLVLPSPSLGPLRTIRTPLRLQKSPSPVNEENRDEFTEEERLKAERGEVASSLDDLEKKLQDLHFGGTCKLGQYVRINTDILEGQALRIEDANAKLLALVFSVPPEYRKLLEDAILRIHICMPGEFTDADSRERFFRYLACHYSWYARYGEKGTGAPTDAHPDTLRKGQGRVNFEQRNARRSKDMKNPNEYPLLVEAYMDFFEILRVALKQYLPAEYDELSIFVEHLPLGASSPCFPFGGFVINLRACTWAHRDVGDKILCFVIPFGNFQGGGLCLYEAGLCLDLKMGDGLVFPSCDLTHFNLHFTGMRGTLVLHSDRHGDQWVDDFNGWASHFVRH
ncbi:hypothetical protein FB45DRAFT_1075268 [Roridomyces roridus]|uniref:Uncharacterized protein n=1 Tax=Roridomyces roridus TaxID=1738132 RepID=A0AAD7CI21_9AGAR|nr:hypothetical protein FB45DRAFT_1075268 [Roridomyces roridus]